MSRHPVAATDVYADLRGREGEREKGREKGEREGRKVRGRMEGGKRGGKEDKGKRRSNVTKHVELSC